MIFYAIPSAVRPVCSCMQFRGNRSYELADFRSNAELANNYGTSILKCKFRKARLNGAMHI